MCVCVQVPEKILQSSIMRVQVHEKILQCNIKCACVYVCVSVSVCVQVPEKILQRSLICVRVCKCQRRSYSVASCVCASASGREDPTV